MFDKQSQESLNLDLFINEQYVMVKKIRKDGFGVV
jgi:hypothetical protein